MEEDGVDFLLAVAGALLVVDADDWRLESDTKAQVNDPVIAHNSNFEEIIIDIFFFIKINKNQGNTCKL